MNERMNEEVNESRIYCVGQMLLLHPIPNKTDRWTRMMKCTESRETAMHLLFADIGQIISNQDCLGLTIGSIRNLGTTKCLGTRLHCYLLPFCCRSHWCIRSSF
jgi:hypothetical protein